MPEPVDNRRLKQVPIPNPRIQKAPTGSVDRFAQFTAGIPVTNTPASVASDLKGGAGASHSSRQPSFTKPRQPKLSK